MKSSTKLFLKQLFKEYYFLRSEKIVGLVNRIHQREIAYTDLESGKMIRHISISNDQEFLKMLSEVTPLHLYHSVAYYLFPEKEMDKKTLIGCDLVFDIDADKLINKGARVTKFYLCSKCGEKYDTEVSNCEKCGNPIKEITWVDNESLGVVKKETKRLLSILIDDFGFSEENIDIYFSGGRGYHIHVFGDLVERLDANIRLEIVDYIKLLSYDARYDVNPNKKTFKVLKRVLEEPDIDFFEEEELEEILRLRRREVDVIQVVRRMNPKLRQKIEEYVKKEEGVEIDPVVTTDMHRLIRFPESIHGGSGLIKKRVCDIDEFDPLREAIFPSDRKVKVLVQYSPKIVINNEEYGPFFNEIVQVPLYLATHLICKGLAEIERGT